MGRPESISAPTFDLAKRSTRVAAYLVDVTVVVVILILKEQGVKAFIHLGFPQFAHSFGYAMLWVIVVYALFCDALPNGQSLGKRVFKLTVVGYPYGPPCSILQAFLRNLPKVLFVLLDGVFALFGLRRRLGDMLAGTIVINAAQAT